MKATVTLDDVATRFDSLSIRERGLIVGAIVAVLVVLWTNVFMDRLNAKEKSLALELSTLETSMAAASQATTAMIEGDLTTRTLAELKERQAALAAVNARLTAESAGLIAPSQMVEVIHDVLSRQQGLVLVSLQNLPVTSLVPEAKKEPDAPVASAGPYLHPVELVVEGRYIDVVTYLHALEALPWRFYWRVLELETKTYPLNRVRIELSTVSMDKEWIGV